MPLLMSAGRRVYLQIPSSPKMRIKYMWLSAHKRNLCCKPSHEGWTIILGSPGCCCGCLEVSIFRGYIRRSCAFIRRLVEAELCGDTELSSEEEAHNKGEFRHSALTLGIKPAVEVGPVPILDAFWIKGHSWRIDAGGSRLGNYGNEDWNSRL